MVIKTDTCSFSENRVYPGRGTRFVRRDGQLAIFATSKSASMYHQSKKPAKLTWTQAWRRLNKKANVEVHSKRRSRRTARLQRAVVGASVEQLKAKRATTTKTSSSKAKDAALKEVKSRQKRRK